MAATENLKPIDFENKPQVQQQATIQQSGNKKKDQSGVIDPLLLAYLEIFHSVQINHETAGISAKEVEVNAAAQNDLINQEAMLNFSTIRKGHKKSIEKVNIHNQEISALRSNLGDKLTVLKQDAQVEETNVNTVMNEDQQSISQSSSLMNMLVSLSNQVSQI